MKLVRCILFLSGLSLMAVSCSRSVRTGSYAQDGVPGQAIVLTEQDASTTAVFQVGRTVEVRLSADRPSSGWEMGPITGNALEPIVEGPVGKADATRQTGQYVREYRFRFRCARAGEATVRFDYLYPVGPEERRATQLLRSATFVVLVKP